MFVVVGKGFVVEFSKIVFGERVFVFEKAEFSFRTFPRRAFRAWNQVCFSRSGASETPVGGSCKLVSLGVQEFFF